MKKHKLLFVDDEPMILESLTQLLDTDYDVHTESVGNDAIEYAKNTPDLAVIISDQRMPGLKGIDVLKAVREVSPNTTRILLTGFADADAILDSVNVGAVFRYIRKPWKSDELISIVELAVANYLAKVKTSDQTTSDHNAVLDTKPTSVSASISETLSILKRENIDQKKSEPTDASLQSVNLLEKQKDIEESFFAKLADRTIKPDGTIDQTKIDKAFQGETGKEKILIVDDESAVLTSLSELLSDYYEVITCSSADQALAMLEKDSFVTLLLTDQRMPKKTGTDLLIESRTFAPLVPKILITAYTDVEDIVRLINEGQIYRYIQKPWNGDKLREVISEAIENYKLQIAMNISINTVVNKPVPALDDKSGPSSSNADQALQAMQAMKAMQEIKKRS